MKRREFVEYGTAGIIGAAATPIINRPANIHPKLSDVPQLKTQLCDLLHIEYPVIQAGMSDVAGPELVAAVSNAGGLGILTATMMPPDVVRQRIQQVREKTDKPFGVNLILHTDLYPPSDFIIENDTVEKVHSTLNVFRRELGIPESNAIPPKLPPLIQMAYEIIIEEKVPVFSIGLGNPSSEMVTQCHDNGIVVMAMVSTLEDAISVYKNGVDIIVAQGSEAGGHRSTWEKKPSKEYAAIGTLPLTAAISNEVDIPVVAAGGIVDGKGLKAVLALGAQGIMMGTRFIATSESMAPESYKLKLIEESSDNTTVTDIFTGMYARVLQNRFTKEYSDSGTPVLPPGRQYAATVDIIKTAGKQDNADLYNLYAGQGIDGIREVLPASDVVAQIIQEALTK